MPLQIKDLKKTIWSYRKFLDVDVCEEDAYSDPRAAAYYHGYWEAVVVSCKRSMTVCHSLFCVTQTDSSRQTLSVSQSHRQRRYRSARPYLHISISPCAGLYLRYDEI